MRDESESMIEIHSGDKVFRISGWKASLICTFMVFVSTVVFVLGILRLFGL